VAVGLIDQGIEGAIPLVLEDRLGVGDGTREAPGVLLELDDQIGVLGGDAVFVLDEVGGHPEEEAGVARLSGDEPADGMGDR